MLTRDPTYLGMIAAVSGAALSVRLAESIASGLSVFKGQTYKVGQVGSFVRVPQGYQDLFGVVSEVGANAVPENLEPVEDTGRWMKVELVGEVIGGTFERGVSQYPNIGDSVHLAVEEHLRKLYEIRGQGHIVIGTLASAESITANVAINELVTRHSAVLGSTGSGKSTTIASLLRSITTSGPDSEGYPNARILLLDLHGEYSMPLADVAQVFSVEPQYGEERLFIPFWALDSDDLLDFLTGGLEGNSETAFTDKIYQLKLTSHGSQTFPGVDSESITVDTPLPFSLKRLWYDLIDFELVTFEGVDRDEPTLQQIGDADTLTPPTYKPHAMGAAGPFLNPRAVGIQRPLNLLRSRLLDRRYNFLLRPGPWEPDLCGKPTRDLDDLLAGWLGGRKPITILDLSGIPSIVLERLVGSILKIVYEALFWSREKTEGGSKRPLLIVMEEAHRYLSDGLDGTATEVVQRIVKEGRKYGVGAMVVSQRPSEVNETILSQCGTFFALRLANPSDRARVQGTLPDGLVGLLDVLPVLRTGEAIVTGEAAKLPMRCRVTFPAKEHRPRSEDPDVSSTWGMAKREEGYERVVASWRAQSPLAVAKDLRIQRVPVEDDSVAE
ncbi:MAG: ATP-binding protein [Caldilineaceae bacterium SB0670_bin_27]|uniref:ATP-binding protein n=1 Tax=Caldilineaceae bacterium SB0664_bin_27 TaxID=2605260 RepID=A0A6B0YV30_9CHLR|nr:ATP-binding protein [Caldilineaceae bacterium]MDE0339881.1 ATP-binding protein [Caldilineaceae bacterium]MXY94974.1 ATP-binding protein [Caldilineaceae bacterium SB0664_bin_27]MYJ78614.1 ATP-binding protein [Caldilineaceae bacterium SB0670_bin_27]